LIGPLGNSQLSSGHVRWKLDYLLHNTFRDSQIKMKDAIMRDPSILKQSLEKIQLRTEVALNLESIGFESVASDIDGFFSRPDSMVTRELCPVETWCPSVKVESSSNDHAYELETLNYFPPPPTFTSADDENRESARVVYWR
jgi:hypothetical protein